MKTPADPAPPILPLPIGLDATGPRKESDSMGTIEVPANHDWGAQTQRSLHHFDISEERMPLEVYRAYGVLKKAAAIVNTRAGLLPEWMGNLIGQVCNEIMASDVAVQMAGAEGNFELNAFRPIVIRDYLHSAKIMAGMCDKFREHMIEGIQLNLTKIKDNLDHSVMMVTALSPHIGYAKAAEIAHHAIARDLSLKQAALALGVDESLFDRVVIPLHMTRP